jgi:putative hydrolase of the HAD superfamily
MTDARETPAICFDATGTLIELRASVGDVYHLVACEHGVDLPAWRLDDAFRRVVRQAPPRGLDGATRDDRSQNEVEWWFERIRQTFQATDSTAHFDDFRVFAQALFDHYARADAWRPRQGIPECLAQLRDQGCFLAVISNFDHRLPQILEALDLIQFFSIIEIPCDRGRIKPARAVFESVCQAASQPMDSLVYVGDDAPEVLAAIAAHGLHVVDVHTVQDSAALADLLMDTSISSAPATLPPTAHTIDP